MSVDLTPVLPVTPTHTETMTPTPTHTKIHSHTNTLTQKTSAVVGGYQCLSRGPVLVTLCTLS